MNSQGEDTAEFCAACGTERQVQPPGVPDSDQENQEDQASDQEVGESDARAETSESSDSSSQSLVCQPCSGERADEPAFGKDDPELDRGRPGEHTFAERLERWPAREVSGAEQKPP